LLQKANKGAGSQSRPLRQPAYKPAIRNSSHVLHMLYDFPYALRVIGLYFEIEALALATV